MTRAFCPKCGEFSFGYDPQTKHYRCYNIGCGFVDKKKEFGEGLSNNPFSIYDPSTDTVKKRNSPSVLETEASINS